MTNKQLIQHARRYLANGLTDQYKVIMAGMLRASMSTRTTNAINKALQEDGVTL